MRDSYGLWTPPSEHRSKVGPSEQLERFKGSEKIIPRNMQFLVGERQYQLSRKMGIWNMWASHPNTNNFVHCLGIFTKTEGKCHYDVTTRSWLCLLRQFTIPVKVGSFRVGAMNLWQLHCRCYSRSAMEAIGSPQITRQLSQWALYFWNGDNSVSVIMEVSCLGPGKTTERRLYFSITDIADWNLNAA